MSLVLGAIGNLIAGIAYSSPAGSWDFTAAGLVNSVVLQIFGLLLGFVPPLREIQLPPETVLLLFLPVMLFWESMTTSLRAIRRSLRGEQRATQIRLGREIARVTPINANDLLFDDALSVRRAQAEHDAFTAILRAEGALVHDFRELLVESLDYPEARALVLEETVGPLAVGVSSRTAGAIDSLTWGGTQFINARDHGRELQSAAAFDGYLNDGRRLALAAQRDAAIERTDVFDVEQIA